MKENERRGILVLIIIAIVFSVVAMVAPFHKNGVFWLSYVFAVISVAVQGYALYAGFVKGDRARSKLYGFPIVRIGTMYMVGQIVLSLVFMALAAVIPLWIVVILCVAALAAASIGMIASEAVREEIEQQDVVLKANVQTMRALQSKARSMVSLCVDADTAKMLKDFSEALQYSDPVSGKVLADIESELTALVDEMQKAVVDGDHSAAAQLCRKATETLNERNRLCKLNKK